MGNSSRNRLFLCFRPVENEGVDCYISVTKMDTDHSQSERKSSFRRSFSGAIKAALLDKSLSRRSRESKRWKIQHQNSETSSSSDETTIIATSTTEPETESLTSTLWPCSSSLSSESSEIRTKEVGKWRRKNHAVYLFVSFWVTVMWGKFVAVVMTTVWVYLFRVYYFDKDKHVNKKNMKLSCMWGRREDVRDGIITVH